MITDPAEADNNREAHAGRHGNSVVVVTGGASGIGLACAQQLVAEGASVALADVDGAAAHEAADRLAEGRAIGLAVDVRSQDDCDRLVATAISTFGRLTGLITAAGLAGPKLGLLDVADEAWSRVLDVNLTGTLHALRSAARQMAPGGAIVTMGSGNGSVARAQNGAYCVSKAGVWMLTKIAALEFGSLGIRVNSVAPGVIHTPMTSALLEDPMHRGRLERATPMGRLGVATDVAKVVSFLLSDEAAYVCGELVAVDGGMATPARV